MSENKKGKIYGIVFLIFLFALIIGGYILTKSLTKHDEAKEPDKSQSEVNKPEESLKLDKDKEYIYFENIDILSEKQKIIYQDVKMNIDVEEVLKLERTLNEQNSSYRQTVKKISEQNLSASEIEKIVYQEDDIYEAQYVKYTRYFSKKYASLVVDKYLFNCFIGSKLENSSSYVIDLENGSVLTNDELMKQFDFTLSKIKDKVEEGLNKMIKEDDTILVDETLENLNDSHNYALYVNKSGYFVISYIVKSSKVDYNDVIILN